jgi:hypothetical protein
MIRIGDSGIRARKSWSPQHLHKICSANFLVNPLICFDRMVDSAQVGLKRLVIDGGGESIPPLTFSAWCSAGLFA